MTGPNDESTRAEIETENGRDATAASEAAEITIRLADRGDLPQVMNVLDRALLDIDAVEVRDRIEASATLVASERESLLGALVLSGSDIEAIAVQRRHRNRGVASALVERARRETDEPLVAEFDGRVRPFYESLAFDIRSIDTDRFRGRDTAK